MALLSLKTVTNFLLAFPRNRCKVSSNVLLNNNSALRCLSISDGNILPIETTSSSISSSQEDIIRQIQQRWLVVGDGDFSYSATIANDLAEQNIQLIATVLEEQSVHEKVYQRSVENTETILMATTTATTGKDKTKGSFPSTTTIENSDQNQQRIHEVQFGIDATRLPDFFPSTKFDRVIFNFPHWKGKTNAKKNRNLISDFFGSASRVINKENNGEICLALHSNQSGVRSSNLQEWRQSWLVHAYAAEHGLILRHLEENYTPEYLQTSHRGRDRSWKKDGFAERLYFTYPNKYPVVDHLQISCRHELRIMLHRDKLETSPVSRNDILDGDVLYNLARELVPEGIRMDVAARDILPGSKWNDVDRVDLAVFLMNYSGEYTPLTRELADKIRANLEETIRQQWKLDIIKAGRLVSRPYPRSLLPTLIKEYNC